MEISQIDIFRIIKKVVPRQTLLQRSRYIVADVEQNRVLYKRNRKASQNTIHPAQLYSSELLHVPTSINSTNLTLADTYRLNKVEPTRNDLQLGDERFEENRRQEEADDDIDYEPRYWAEEDYEPRYWNPDDYAEPTRRSTRII
jgi:hypothetical protein